MIAAPEIDLISLAPVLVLSVFTMLVMLMDLFIGKNKSALTKRSVGRAVLIVPGDDHSMVIGKVII